MDLAEKTLAELNELADMLREVISRDPQTPGTELENVKWEVEKRHWRACCGEDIGAANCR